ncbi:MAG: potassium channel family protein [Pseudonocardiaceae bacterium]
MTNRRYDQLSPRARRWLVVRSLLRSLLAVTVLVAAYYLAPLSEPLGLGTVVKFVVGLLVVAGVLAWEIRAILRSEVPRLDSIRVLAVGLPLLLLFFATAFYLLSAGLPGSFNEPLSRTDALYFTMTVFATVGFGDIVPTTELARIITMTQMVVGLVVVGIVAKIVLGAVQVAVARRAQAPAEPTGDVGSSVE